MMNLVDIAHAIHEERLARNWSQYELASKMGVSQPTVHRVEAGAILPTATFIKKANRALGTHFDIPQKRPKLSLTETVAEARRLGMSYGEYESFRQNGGDEKLNDVDRIEGLIRDATSGKMLQSDVERLAPLIAVHLVRNRVCTAKE